MARRGYLGSAKPTTLRSGMSAGDSSAVASDLSTWAGIASTGSFSVTINRGEANEETILVGAINTGTNTLSSITRNYADSTGVAHNPGETVEHTTSKVDADEANAHINDTTRDDHTQYARTDMSRTLTGSVTATNANHSFGGGALGAAAAFTQVGNSGGAALVSAGHGTLADASLVLRAKGTGNVELKSGSDVARAGSIGENAFLGVEIAAPASAVGCVMLGSATGIPSANPVGGGVLYVDTGVLKYRGPTGTITTLGPA